MPMKTYLRMQCSLIFRTTQRNVFINFSCVSLFVRISLALLFRNSHTRHGRCMRVCARVCPVRSHTHTHTNRYRTVCDWFFCCSACSIRSHFILIRRNLINGSHLIVSSYSDVNVRFCFNFFVVPVYKQHVYRNIGKKKYERNGCVRLSIREIERWREWWSGRETCDGWIRVMSTLTRKAGTKESSLCVRVDVFDIISCYYYYYLLVMFYGERMDW